MASFSIESNGRIEKTALYLNGEQISGIREILIHINEDGTFDAVIEYEGTDGIARTKQLFSDYLDKIKVVEPSFTEEESANLQLLTVESDGYLENTFLYLNKQELEGVVDLFLHIKRGNTPTSFASFLNGRKSPVTDNEFKADITYRNADDSQSLEQIFL